MLKAAYKPTCGEKVRATVPDWQNSNLLTVGKPFAAEDVNDLRPLRGALPRVIELLPRFGWISIMGAAAPFFLKKGTNDL